MVDVLSIEVSGTYSVIPEASSSSFDLASPKKIGSFYIVQKLRHDSIHSIVVLNVAPYGSRTTPIIQKDMLSITDSSLVLFQSTRMGLFVL